MKPTCTLDVIRNIASTELTAFQSEHLNKARAEQGIDYSTYMKKEYGDHPLDVCEQLFLDDLEEEWFDYQEYIRGFEAGGSLFYLDTQEKIVFAITDKNKDGKYHGAIVHYCPYPNETYNEFEGEYITADREFFEGIFSGRYDLSTNDEELISKLDNLILG